MGTKTYDPAKVLVSFAGNLLTGFAPDTFITITFDEDAFSKQVGASGEVARAKNNNRGGSATLTLMAHSQTNDILSAIANADALAGTGVGAFFVKELNGTTKAAAQNAWVKKMPDVERGKENGTVQWVFDCADLDVLVGGLL